jgi:hypothetical protein
MIELLKLASALLLTCLQLYFYLLLTVSIVGGAVYLLISYPLPTLTIAALILAVR